MTVAARLNFPPTQSILLLHASQSPSRINLPCFHYITNSLHISALRPFCFQQLPDSLHNVTLALFCFQQLPDSLPQNTGGGVPRHFPPFVFNNFQTLHPSTPNHKPSSFNNFQTLFVSAPN